MLKRFAVIALFFAVSLALLSACGLDEELESVMADATPLNGLWIAESGSGRAGDLYARRETTFLFDSGKKKYFSDSAVLGGGEFPFTVRRRDGDVFLLTMRGRAVTIWLMDNDTGLMLIEGERRALPLTRRLHGRHMADGHGD